MCETDRHLFQTSFIMASVVNMSLEDIIERKKKRTRHNPNMNKNFKNPKLNQKNVITDARNKIIAKKRTHITDAREKLAELAKQKDARLKLEQLRQKKLGTAKTAGRKRFPMGHMPDIRANWTRSNPNFEMVFQDHTRQVRSQNRQMNSKTSLKHQITTKKFMETRSFGTRDSGSFPLPKPIVRTVENDIIRVDDEDDPMGEDFTLPMRASLNRKASLNLKIIARNNDIRSKSSGRRTVPSEREKSPPRLTSILKKRPMAALRTEKKPEKREEPANEYRIIVSNLRNTVTSGDIQELFGDVGGMKESRLARPGIAEVIYKTQEDAQRAVELYHNRQLDGQPMTCLLVTPRTAAAPSRNSSNLAKPSLPPSSNSNVEPDLSTFHKVLFSNF